MMELGKEMMVGWTVGLDLDESGTASIRYTARVCHSTLHSLRIIGYRQGISARSEIGDDLGNS